MRAAENKLHVEYVHATILELMGLDPNQRTSYCSSRWVGLDKEELRPCNPESVRRRMSATLPF